MLFLWILITDFHRSYKSSVRLTSGLGIPVKAESGPRAISTLLWPMHEVTGLQLCPLFRDTQYPHLFVSDDLICVVTEVLTFCTLQHSRP